MPNGSKKMDGQRCIELTPDFLGESRHEFVAKLAYQYWEQRGMPLGSPEVDWFAAERAVYQSLVASGLGFAIRKKPAGYGAGDLPLVNLPTEGRQRVGTDSRTP
jgi:Protein of unknown function (DUF2934)